MPKRYLHAEVGDLSESRLRLLPAILSGDGCFITGKVGVGKTYTAAAIFREMIEVGLADRLDYGGHVGSPYRYASGPHKTIEARFVDVPAMFADLQASMGAKKHDITVQELRRLKLVLLDDVGAQKRGDWTQQVLHEIISARINNMLPTIVTSNATLQELSQQDPRIASRLSGLVVMAFGKDAPDLRIAKAGKDVFHEQKQ